MADVLSQSQIDMLLNSMRGGDAEADKKEVKEEKKYKSYDFYSPKKFTKDKLKILKGIYDNYCRIIVSQLNGILRMNCEIEVTSVEETRYHEFGNALGENDVMELMFLKLPDDSKNPPLLFHINQLLVVNMIDSMLGGEGGETELDFEYTYTDIELALYGRLVKYFSGAIKDSWKNYLALDVESLRLEQSPSMFQEIGLDEPVAIVMLNMILANVSGFINICIPGNLLTNIFSIIEKRRDVQGAYDNGITNSREIMMEKLRESELEMKVNLGTAHLSFQDIYGLRVNDVIDLNKSRNSDVMVYVANQPWFEGKLGVYKNNVAVKLNKKVQEESEEQFLEEVFTEEVPAN